jgi:hypothetical protein
MTGCNDERLDEAEDRVGVVFPAWLRARYTASDGFFRQDGQWWVVWPLDRVESTLVAWEEGSLDRSPVAFETMGPAIRLFDHPLDFIPGVMSGHLGTQRDVEAGAVACQADQEDAGPFKGVCHFEPSCVKWPHLQALHKRRDT